MQRLLSDLVTLAAEDTGADPMPNNGPQPQTQAGPGPVHQIPEHAVQFERLNFFKCSIY